MARDGGEAGIRLLVVRERDEGDRQRPAAASRPRVVVDLELLAEHRSLTSRKNAPGGDQIAGGIAHADEGEVEDAGQVAVPDEQVSGQEVSVKPHRRTGPVRGSQSLLPR